MAKKPKKDRYETKRDRRIARAAAFDTELQDIETRLRALSDRMLVAQNDDHSDATPLAPLNKHAYAGVAHVNEKSKALINDAVHCVRTVRNGVSGRR